MHKTLIFVCALNSNYNSSHLQPPPTEAQKEIDDGGIFYHIFQQPTPGMSLFIRIKSFFQKHLKRVFSF